MSFFFFFNYSKYLNQTYFLINKPLNSCIKHTLLAKAKCGNQTLNHNPQHKTLKKIRIWNLINW